MSILNQIWDFFASVRLAIFTLIALAITSIAGTIIPQNESVSFYVKNFGPQTAHFFQILDLDTMYYSWWFLGLLGLLSANLIVCSIERFPTVWKIIHTDNYNTKLEKLQKMQNFHSWELNDQQAISADNLLVPLKNLRWSLVLGESTQGTMYFAQKNRWSRTGVYLVHISILVIFAGAILGHFTGFKGSVMIPELQSSAVAYSFKEGTPLQLGFDVRCEWFNIEFYPNGMPKEYQSKLTIFENQKEVLSKVIEVNDPLSYKGITFYQSSYQGYQNFIVTFKDTKTGDTHNFPVQFQKQQGWQDTDIRFGIINAEAIGQRVVRAKIWVKAGNDKAVIKWLEEGDNITVSSGGNEFTISAKQMYATGLQVAKDPGVWIVYLGCGLMLIGLYMAFFLSHKRIWLFISSKENDRPGTVSLAGLTNKNKPGFIKEFNKLKSALQEVIN